MLIDIISGHEEYDSLRIYASAPKYTDTDIAIPRIRLVTVPSIYGNLLFNVYNFLIKIIVYSTNEYTINVKYSRAFQYGDISQDGLKK